ncbi:AMP-dependent synthetase/ligase [Magnetospira thiophila]
MADMLASLLKGRARRNGQATALIDNGQILTFHELADRVVDAAAWAAGLPTMVGLIGPKCADWVIADLALTLAGKTLVPLPEFFSRDQLSHIITDSGLSAIVLVGEDQPDNLAAGPALWRLGTSTASWSDLDPALSARSQRIIYTSGTTGRPKGVRLDETQVSASAAALVAATGAQPTDIHLSVLPYSLLLEQIAGIRAPLIAGATAVICRDGFSAALRGDPRLLVAAAEQTRPTISVLVPELLDGWLRALQALGQKAPPSLRFLAVGGASIPPALAEAAWNMGLPVHEGYGLSECCSVVALNRPGERRPGTVGQPLPELKITIEDGEIIVQGPTVMQGYLNKDPLSTRRWPTGDLGRLRPDGSLEVFGRKDQVIVTALGRNVSPEWIEALVLADRAISQAVAFGNGGSFPALAVCFHETSESDPEERVRAILAPLPDYARPRHIIVTTLDDLRRKGLLAPSGKPRRKMFAAHYGTNRLEHHSPSLEFSSQESQCLSTNN